MDDAIAKVWGGDRQRCLGRRGGRRDPGARFWIMDHATAGVGRTYPQHQEMGPRYNYDGPRSVHEVPWDRFADFEPNFNTVIIHGSAKLTDLISSAPLCFSGLLVSRRFLALLAFARLPPHRVYSVPVRYRGRPVAGYFWGHMPHQGLQLPERAAADAVQALIAADPTVSSADLFLAMSKGPLWFVSDRLRVAVIELGLTGFEFYKPSLPRRMVS